MTQSQFVTRFPNGLGTVPEGYALEDFKLPSFRTYHSFYDDFLSYTAADWTVTETQAGATQAVDAGAFGGIMVLTNTAADNDLDAIQWPNETFTWDDAKQFVIDARFKLSDVVDSDAIVGVYITDTSPLASLPSDGVFFYKADDAATLICSIRKDGTSTSVSMGSMVADTYVRATAIYSPELAEMKVYLNDALVGIITDFTNAPDDEFLAPGIAVQNGAAASKVLSIDWLYVGRER